MANACTHLDEARVFDTDKDYCEECIRSGSGWVHLRMCLICGHVGCCDSSPNHHASKHARAASHPVIASAERGERWLYCFPDDAFVEY